MQRRLDAVAQHTVPAQVRGNAAGSAAGRDVLHDAVVVPMPPLEVRDVEQVGEFGADGSQPALQISNGDPGPSQAIRSHRDYQIFQSRRDDLRRKPVVEVGPAKTEPGSEVTPSLILRAV